MRHLFGEKNAIVKETHVQFIINKENFLSNLNE